MTILVVVVVLTLFISAHCSLFEAVLYSTRIGALEAHRTKSKFKSVAGRMMKMKRHIGVPISGILILNTLANTAGATFAGMYAHEVLGAGLVIAVSPGHGSGRSRRYRSFAGCRTRRAAGD